MSRYSEKLRDPRWQKLRLKVFERDGFKCSGCDGDKETLNVHHLVYSKGEPWDAPVATLETLCDSCHQFRESFNEFFGGRSIVPTAFCSYFFQFYGGAFDGSCGSDGIYNPQSCGQFFEAVNKVLLAATAEREKKAGVAPLTTALRK